MPVRQHLNNNERQRALGQLLAGQSHRNVAAQLNVSHSVIDCGSCALTPWMYKADQAKAVLA